MKSPCLMACRRFDALAAGVAGAPDERWVLCAGDSMAPTVTFGTPVCVVPTQRVRSGDVVVLQNQAGYVLHRVVWPLPGLPWILHIGDSPDVVDVGVARRDRVVGKAVLPRRLPSYRAYGLACRRLCRAISRRVLRGLAPPRRA